MISIGAYFELQAMSPQARVLSGAALGSQCLLEGSGDLVSTTTATYFHNYLLSVRTYP